jgi:hypothetical protein
VRLRATRNAPRTQPIIEQLRTRKRRMCLKLSEKSGAMQSMHAQEGARMERAEGVPVARITETRSRPSNMLRITVTTGIDGCRHVASVTPASCKPRI